MHRYIPDSIRTSNEESAQVGTQRSFGETFQIGISMTGITMVTPKSVKYNLGPIIQWKSPALHFHWRICKISLHTNLCSLTVKSNAIYPSLIRAVFFLSLKRKERARYVLAHYLFVSHCLYIFLALRLQLRTVEKCALVLRVWQADLLISCAKYE